MGERGKGNGKERHQGDGGRDFAHFPMVKRFGKGAVGDGGVDAAVEQAEPLVAVEVAQLRPVRKRRGRARSRSENEQDLRRGRRSSIFCTRP